ncbi:unnamed protein product [Ascophyllum nodosum]
MGSFAPVAIGVYKYVSKGTDEYTMWTAVYLLASKNQPLQSLKLFIGSTFIPFRGRIDCWRADKGGKYIKENTIQDFTATNTPQQIGVSAGGLSASWFDVRSQTAAFHRPCRRSCSWLLLTSNTGLRTRYSRCRRHSRYFMARKPTFRTFASSEPEPSCTSKIPKSSMPWSGKRRCAAITRGGNPTESGTQRFAASRRAGTSPSSRQRRTCFSHLQSSFRCKILYRRRGTTTLWTMNTFHTTTYCGM